jgi:hypothetical protein
MQSSTIRHMVALADSCRLHWPSLLPFVQARCRLHGELHVWLWQSAEGIFAVQNKSKTLPCSALRRIRILDKISKTNNVSRSWKINISNHPQTLPSLSQPAACYWFQFLSAHIEPLR